MANIKGRVQELEVLVRVAEELKFSGKTKSQLTCLLEGAQEDQTVSEIADEIRRRCLEENVLVDYLSNLGGGLEDMVRGQRADEQAMTDSACRKENRE